MPDRRCIVHVMHETELGYARSLVRNPESTEAAVIGTITDDDAKKLRDRGLVVQYLDETPQPLPRRRRRIASRAAGAGVFMDAPLSTPDVILPATAARQYQVSLAGPLIGTWRRSLEATGATVLKAVPGGVILIMTPALAPQVQALSFVLSAEPLRAAATDADDVQARATPQAGGVQEMVTYDAILIDGPHRQEVLDWLAEHQAVIGAASSAKIRFHAPESSTTAAELQQRTDWVQVVEPFVVPEVHNDRARTLLGIDANGTSIALQGAGEIIGVADTGVDKAHPDLAARLKHVIPLGRPGDSSDPHGHGTHVAGSIAGDGSSSGGQIRGVAPKADLVFQSLLDSANRLGGLPFELQALFQEAYDLGARIHNNSWGAATKSSYRVNSLEVDDFAYRHKDMLIVISAGNDGTAADPRDGIRKSQKGFVDWMSIGSPATAKNALTVGASRSDRTSGGYSALTYGQAWPDAFFDDPIKSERVSANAEAISGFSSRGPCDDYRIKPDLVAPGTDILSCRSSTAPVRNFWGPHPANASYAYMGGTSMAAPLVAGCAALVREFYRTMRGHQPSAALLKATLINGTRWLTATDARADFADQPNYHQGFGCVSLPDSLPAPVGRLTRLEFIDNWQDPATQLASDERRRWQFTVQPDGSPLRVCLVHTDPPDKGLQNNLNMLLEVPNAPSKLYGNMQLPMGLNRPDAVNNVEVIRVANPPAGNYIVQVGATSILRPRQDFALIVSGPIASPLQRI